MILGLLTVGSLIWYLVTVRPTGDLQLIGTVDANEVMVSAKIPGRIQTLTVKEGDQVKAGQLIAVIESDDLEAAREGGRGHGGEPEVEAGRDSVETERQNTRRNQQRHRERRGAGEGRAGRCGAGAGELRPPAGRYQPHRGAGPARHHERSRREDEQVTACRPPRRPSNAAQENRCRGRGQPAPGAGA